MNEAGSLTAEGEKWGMNPFFVPMSGAEGFYCQRGPGIRIRYPRATSLQTLGPSRPRFSRASARLWRRGGFAIITTEPNELCAELHNRMPVALKPRSCRVWLGEEPAGPVRSEGPARAVSVSGNDVSACERAGGKRKRKKPKPDRTDCRLSLL